MHEASKGALLAEELIKIIAVVGPTASGKTELAVDLARALGGEVVSADSRQIYRRLDAGTAKPQRDAHGLVEGIAYHLLDAADPSESFDAGRYARLAQEKLDDIQRRGLRPIVAGGTGLYVRVLLQGLSEMPGRDERVRRRLDQQAKVKGRPWLHRRLGAVDPVAAGKIPVNNIQRVLRALEVYEVTGKPISSFWDRAKASSNEAVVLFIDWPAERLKERIARRAEAMWPAMLQETRDLLNSGYDGTEPGFLSLGYREAVSCLRGRLADGEGLAKLVLSTNQYAKRQRTWFRNQNPDATVIPGGSRGEMLCRSLEALGSPALAR